MIHVHVAVFDPDLLARLSGPLPPNRSRIRFDTSDALAAHFRSSKQHPWPWIGSPTWSDVRLIDFFGGLEIRSGERAAPTEAAQAKPRKADFHAPH